MSFYSILHFTCTKEDIDNLRNMIIKIKPEAEDWHNEDIIYESMQLGFYAGPNDIKVEVIN